MRRLAIFALLLAGCAAGRETELRNEVGCDRLTAVEGATTSASGLVHFYPLEPEWLRRSLSPAEADDYLWEQWVYWWNAESREALAADSMFVGMQLNGWRAVQAKQQASDQFWYYSTPDSYWNALAGQEGVVLIRSCAVVGNVVISQS